MIELVGNENPTGVLGWLENEVRPHLRPDVSNYAKGRMRVWLGMEPSLTKTHRLSPGFPISDKLANRLAELIGWKFDYCLATYSGDEKPIGISAHRDAAYANYEARSWNISGTCLFSYWEGRKSFGYSKSEKEYNPETDPPTAKFLLEPGNLLRFNCKNLHSAEPSAQRWNLNFWRAKSAPYG